MPIGEEADDHDGLKPGSVAGIVLGIIIFVILCIGGILIIISTGTCDIIILE